MKDHDGNMFCVDKLILTNQDVINAKKFSVTMSHRNENGETENSCMVTNKSLTAFSNSYLCNYSQ